MRAFPIASFSLTLLLAGCGNSEFDDLRAWMDSVGKDGASKIEPLPQVKQVEAFEYQQGALSDPFMARSLRQPARAGCNPMSDGPNSRWRNSRLMRLEWSGPSPDLANP